MVAKLAHGGQLGLRYCDSWLLFEGLARKVSQLVTWRVRLILLVMSQCSLLLLAGKVPAVNSFQHLDLKNAVTIVAAIDGIELPISGQNVIRNIRLTFAPASAACFTSL